MSDRLSELLRQRALLQEHLAWFDREIDAAARSSSSPSGAALPRPAPTDVPAFPLTPPLPTVSVAAIPPAPSPHALTARLAGTVPVPPAESVVVPGAEAILDQYRVEPRSVQQDVRKGCFLYFAAAFVLLGLGVVALYFLISSR